MKCRGCGNEISEDDFRCPKCGKKNNFKGRKKARVYLIIFLVLLISMTLLIVVGMLTSKPVNAPNSNNEVTNNQLVSNDTIES